MVQVLDDGAGVALAKFPLSGVRAAFLAAFGKQKLLVGPGVVHHLHMVKVVAAVPVKARAPHVFGGLGVAVDHICALHQAVAVVVPHNDLDMAQACGLQHRPQVVAHKVALFFGGVNAAVPALHRLGLVLHRHAPDGHALGCIGLNKFDIATRPSVAVLGQQMTALVHLPIALHPGRWAPGRSQQLQRPARHFLRRPDHGQQSLAVAVDVEAVQVHIAGHIGMRIVAQRKVAAVHVHAAQRVAVAVLRVRVKVGAQQLCLARGAQVAPGDGGGFGKGSTKAFQGLEGFGGVEVEAGGRACRLTCGLRTEGRLGKQRKPPPLSAHIG